MFLEGVAEIVGGGVRLQHVDVHVIVGLADGSVGGRVGAGLVVGAGGGLGGCVAEAGEAEGGGWPVGVVVVVGGEGAAGGFGVAISVFVHGVRACTGSRAGNETVSCARTVVVGVVIIVSIVMVGRERCGGFRVSIVMLVHGIGACTGSSAGYETVSYARAVVVRFGAPGTWRNGHEGIFRLRAHGRVLGEAGSLFGVHVVVGCSSGHEWDGRVVVVRGDFTALCGSVVGVVPTWVDGRLPWLRWSFLLNCIDMSALVATPAAD